MCRAHEGQRDASAQVLADRRRIRGAARVPGRTQSGAGRG
uniref:Repressor n=1 Tax=Klebsiella pneumoniae TaxID=573 RepID=A0A411KXG2_KLEPN|nr:repressor [Klebsiella pneumoniae]